MKPSEFATLLGTRKLIGYGATLAFLSLKETTGLPFAYLVDDTPELYGQSVDGVLIYPREHLAEESPDEVLVLLCAFRPRSILAMSDRLRQMGFVAGRDFLNCSPLLFSSLQSRLAPALGITCDWDLFARVRTLCEYGASANLTTPVGTWLFIQLLDSLGPEVPGDVVECGVYQGHNALVTRLLSRTIGQRNYHLLDSFTGFGEYADWEPPERRHEFQDVDFPKLQAMFSGFDNVFLYPGFFRETLPTLPERAYSLVYLDADVYEPTLQCCEYFWPRLSPGGYLLCHDYWLPTRQLPVGGKRDFLGAHRAINEFFATQEKQLLVLPETTHVLIRKPLVH